VLIIRREQIVSIELKPREPRDHKYRVRIAMGASGEVIGGWLSPDLRPNCGRADRSLILISLLPKRAPAEYRQGFEEFANRTREFGKGGFAATKRRAAQGMRDGAASADLRVALHKMGPVAAYAFPGGTHLPPVLDGATADLVGFPKLVDMEHGERISAELDLFEAMTSADAARIFRCYLEDISEHLKDISDKLDIAEGMRRIKAVREILGQSIREKLRVLTPSSETWTQYRQRRLTGMSFENRQCRWFDENYQTIGETLFLVCLIEFCIERFCYLLGLRIDVVGITLRGEAYDLEDWRRKFCAVYGIPSSFLENSEIVTALEQAVEFFVDDRIDSFHTAADHPIIRNIVEYLVFIGTIQGIIKNKFDREDIQSRLPIVFLSRLHRSAFGRTVDHALRQLAQASIITFDGSGGEPIRPTVKAWIWLADAVWSILPEADDGAREDSADAHKMRWIYLEAEHATLLGKPVTGIARTRSDVQRSLAQIERVEEPMLADNVLSERASVRDATVRVFAEHVVVEIPNEAELQERASGLVGHGREQAIQRQKFRNLIAGYLRLFEDIDVHLISFIFEQYAFRTHKFSKAKIGRELAAFFQVDEDKAERMFGNLYDRGRKFALQVDGRLYAFQIVELLKNMREYRFQLDHIALMIAGNLGITDRAVIKADIGKAIRMVRR
jgi:hypothetical protein